MSLHYFNVSSKFRNVNLTILVEIYFSPALAPFQSRKILPFPPAKSALFRFICLTCNVQNFVILHVMLVDGPEQSGSDSFLLEGRQDQDLPGIMRNFHE